MVGYIRVMLYLGELAALTTAVMWAGTSVFFSEAGKQIGSFFVNKIRLLMAVAIYAVIHFITTGSPFPAEINSTQLLWLGTSGFIGLVIGDSCYFKSLVMIGPRLTTIVFSTSPILTSIIAWFLLDESLSLLNLLGIAVTVGGIVWVVSERQYSRTVTNGLRDGHPDSGSLLKGVMLALGAALGQGLGLVLAKQGMFHAGGTVEPFEASFVRMTVALVGIWTISAIRGQLPQVIRSMRDRKAMLMSLGGATCGPFLGVWMSLVALKYIETGIAATLNSMVPVAVIPVVIFYYKEKVSLRAMLGAVIAVCGVALLFLS